MTDSSITKRPIKYSGQCGDISAVMLNNRHEDSQYVVSIMTGYKGVDRSYWLEVVEASDKLKKDHYKLKMTLADLVMTTLSKRTQTRFGRGLQSIKVLVQQLDRSESKYMTAFNSINGCVID